MGKVTLYSAVIASVLLKSIFIGVKSTNECIGDVIKIQGMDLGRYRQECMNELNEGSIFRCMLGKIIKRCSEEGVDGTKEVKSTFCAFAWLKSLPMLTPNTAIINEITEDVDIGDELEREYSMKRPVQYCTHYRVDFGAYYDMLIRYNTRAENAARNFTEIFGRILFPSSIDISASVAHTMSFGEHVNAQLYGFNSFRNAFLLAFFHGPFHTAVQGKSKMRFRMRVDQMWRIRSHMYVSQLLRALRSLVSRYRNYKFVDRRLKNYDLSRFSKNQSSGIPLLPFFNLVKDDFYSVLEGTNLLAQEDILDRMHVDGSKDDRSTFKINFRRLISNLVCFIKDSKRAVVGKLEPFYVAEACVYNVVYTFYNIMSAKACDILWQQPRRYMIRAKIQNPQHKLEIVTLLKIFAMATFVTISVVGITINKLIA